MDFVEARRAVKAIEISAAAREVAWLPTTTLSELEEQLGKPSDVHRFTSHGQLVAMFRIKEGHATVFADTADGATLTNGMIFVTPRPNRPLQ